MTYLGINFMQPSLDAISTSMEAFRRNSQDKNLHLQLKNLHTTQRNLYTNMAPNDTANREKYERWIEIHHALRETHEALYNQIHERDERNALMRQPQSRGQDF